jgi:bifunctional non-homologous end joining protein LigD
MRPHLLILAAVATLGVPATALAQASPPQGATTTTGVVGGAVMRAADDPTKGCIAENCFGVRMHMDSSLIKNGNFDGLYLGRKSGRKFVYAGKIETGFTDDDERMLLRKLEPLQVPNQPVASSGRATNFGKGTRWVKPQATYRTITEHGGLLRHAKFKELREDLA